jgi:hypothetical protein
LFKPQFTRGNCAKAAVHLLCNACDPAQHLQEICTGSSRHLRSSIRHLSIRTQKPCAGLIHIHSSFRTPVQQSRTAAYQRRSSFTTKRGSCAKATVYLKCSAWAQAQQRHDTCTLSFRHLRSSIKNMSKCAGHQRSIVGSVAQHRRSICASASDTYSLASGQMDTRVTASAQHCRDICISICGIVQQTLSNSSKASEQLSINVGTHGDTQTPRQARNLYHAYFDSSKLSNNQLRRTKSHMLEYKVPHTLTPASRNLYSRVEHQRTSVVQASQIKRGNCAKATVYLLCISCIPAQRLQDTHRIDEELA